MPTCRISMSTLLSAEKRLHVGTGPSSYGQPGGHHGEDEEAKLILLMEDIIDNTWDVLETL